MYAQGRVPDDFDFDLGLETGIDQGTDPKVAVEVGADGTSRSAGGSSSSHGQWHYS